MAGEGFQPSSYILPPFRSFHGGAEGVPVAGRSAGAQGPSKVGRRRSAQPQRTDRVPAPPPACRVRQTEAWGKRARAKRPGDRRERRLKREVGTPIAASEDERGVGIG